MVRWQNNVPPVCPKTLTKPGLKVSGFVLIEAAPHGATDGLTMFNQAKVHHMLI